MASTYRDDDEGTDIFREEFKRYKRKEPPPDFSEVIDFTNELITNNNCNVIPLNHAETTKTEPRLFGLRPVYEWKVYYYKTNPGFVFISNPFTAAAQRYWTHRCLHDYPSKQNVTNLDFIEKQCGINRPDNIWTASENYESGKAQCFVDSLSFDMRFHMNKLRWVTLGYHYNWNDKTYSKNQVSTFPFDLEILAKYIASVVGFKEYNPEAAIVNYYHMGSTLAGHTDHSEFDHDSPIISFSFGQDAIFLLGGVTKAVKPAAFHLRSGDICIMAGDSRLCYHAVPRVLPSKHFETSCNARVADELAELNSFVYQNTPNSRENSGLGLINSTDCDKINKKILTTLNSLHWENYENFLKESRINISVRQVLKIGQSFPDHTNSEVK
ncbi:nucleic acid dioxygenase ALKBH1-like [Octopus vulgaris]|uniref:Nucleic acid dioxygenase ALKBH1-like n=1 Tax=Octopus vulgaris TaxID=6645 RepID=A0AA36AWQ0_OCTVU|nr:nucleic acid dioxygenase ALKBH1-like [Octopus vulgaris]